MSRPPQKPLGDLPPAARRLRQLRRAWGLTRKEAAHEAGMPEATLRRWEDGHNEPSEGEYVRQLAAIYRVRPGYILDGDHKEGAVV